VDRYYRATRFAGLRRGELVKVGTHLALGARFVIAQSASFFGEPSMYERHAAITMPGDRSEHQADTRTSMEPPNWPVTISKGAATKAKFGSGTISPTCHEVRGSRQIGSERPTPS
jgi:hypothetical protein